LIICGSYRRGKLLCNDIDVLLTHENETKLLGLLDNIIKHLVEKNFLIDHFSLPSNDTKHKSHNTYMGICKLPSLQYKYFRHIDIKIYPPHAFPFSLLYFTGSDHFNRSMRYFAKNKGYTLSDHGIAPAIRVNNDKVHVGLCIPCKTEEDIFTVLGLKYIKPVNRNTYETFSPFIGTHESDDEIEIEIKNENENENENENNNCNENKSVSKSKKSRTKQNNTIQDNNQ